MILSYAVAFVLLMIASYTDWRTTEVPDWLSYAGIAIAFALRGLWSVQMLDIMPLAEGVVGCLACGAAGAALYYARQWGGGDAKILMAMGALLGANIILANFVLNMALVGGLYGLTWMVALSIKNAQAVKKEVITLMRHPELARMKKYAYACVVLLFIAGIFLQDPLVRMFSFVIAFVVLALYYMFTFTKAVENVCLIKKLKPNQLMEGDWVLTAVKQKGRYVCRPTDLGITKKQIQQLKKLKKTVTIKAGIPFVPSFLFAYVLTLLGLNIGTIMFDPAHNVVTSFALLPLTILNLF